MQTHALAQNKREESTSALEKKQAKLEKLFDALKADARETELSLERAQKRVETLEEKLATFEEVQEQVRRIDRRVLDLRKQTTEMSDEDIELRDELDKVKNEMEATASGLQRLQATTAIQKVVERQRESREAASISNGKVDESKKVSVKDGDVTPSKGMGLKPGAENARDKKSYGDG